MARKPIVWVIKEQVKRGITGPEAMDYTPAMKFGELRFITEMDPPLYPRSSIQMRWDEQVDKFVEEFNPRTDFIVATGNPVAMVMIGYRLGEVGGTPPTFLVWRREEGNYIPLITK